MYVSCTCTIHLTRGWPGIGMDGKSERPSIVGRLALACRASIFLIPWLSHLLIADIALSALLPISWVFPTLAQHISSSIAASVWGGIQFIFTRINRANIIVSGADKLPPNESAIVVSNHVEWTDFSMIQALAIRSGMLGRCRWFAKKQLRYVPLLGWGLWAMGMPLVSRQWATDQNEINKVFRNVVEKRWPIWLISYSEGTRFSSTKRAETEAWCKANDKRLGNHTLYPRTKGFVACVQKLRNAPQIKAVYDVTIAYAKNDKIFQSPPTFTQMLMTPRLDQTCRFLVHVDRHAIDDLPKDDEGLARWLEDRWVAKGSRLQSLREQLQSGMIWEPE